eukprot:TRINITY_DN5390_c0_g1_i1.p1 TRINITY_DN5390_c0_g1~~TRINITY_DN5390_c0_g1_i1.p1  ORF type:complete len:135 (-),score=8.04 TRINITY_DN5390_c0_g1_i1:440-844(-)
MVYEALTLSCRGSLPLAVLHELRNVQRNTARQQNKARHAGLAVINVCSDRAMKENSHQAKHHETAAALTHVVTESCPSQSRISIVTEIKHHTVTQQLMTSTAANVPSRLARVMWVQCADHNDRYGTQSSVLFSL